MEILKSTFGNHNKTLVWVITVLLIAFGWFYWFQWRPSEIRGTCAKQAGDSASKVYEALSGSNLDYKMEMSEKNLKTIYELCLNKHGIKN